MRLHRIRVEDVRGIPAAEVCFAAHGVTLIEAPNETGKTSLFEAFDLLLSEKHGTRKRAVQNLRPVGRDVGSLVEAELTIGEVRLTVRKRFNRNQMTELAVHAPRRRQLTGDDAHQELRRLLVDGTDLPLFEALRFRQGRSLDSLALADSEHLARRLDAVAGGTGDTGDDVLHERVLEEYHRYFTPSGQPGKVLRAADAAVADAAAEVERLEAARAGVDADAQRLVDLEGDHARLTGTLAELRPLIDEHHRVLTGITDLRARAQTLHARIAAATAERDRLQREVVERRSLIDRIARLGEELGRRTEIRGAAASRLERYEARLADLADEVADAEAIEAMNRDRLAVARSVAETARQRERLRALEARRGRIEAALAEGRSAEVFLAGHAWTDNELDELRAADDAVRLAVARHGDAVPRILVRAHQDLDIDVNGEAGSLSAGEGGQYAASERFAIRVADVLDVEVRPGTSLAERQAEVETARRRLQECCVALGVPDRAAAEALFRERDDHRRVLGQRDATIQRELDGMARDELDAEIRRLQASIEAAESVADTAAGSTVGEAEPAQQLTLTAPATGAELAELEHLEGRARDHTGELRARHAELVGEVERLRSEFNIAASAVSTGESELDRAVQQLTDARAGMSDAELGEAAEAAAGAVAERAAELGDVDDELRHLHADEVEQLARTAEEEHRRCVDELTTVREEATTMRTRIELRGGEGLGEALLGARVECDRLIAEQRSLWSRAAAAATLKDAFVQAREAAYTAYRAPLRARIVESGRRVFGRDLDIELDEELRVVSRTIADCTLDFDQLSAGAREQLAILTAVAAADLAGVDGVPLILDDTLGATDPRRLERLCEVLGSVDGPQIVILTCDGGRFRAVPGATVVDLLDRVPTEHEAALTRVG